MPPKVEEKQARQVTYTCPMHPEIHASKPGNCPKCGMKLVKEKEKPNQKVVAKPAVKKPDEMRTPKDTAQTKKIVTDDKEFMKMKGMDMPMKASSEKIDNREDMDKMKMPRTKLEPVKTILNNISPHTVRYDLYIADTMVNFSGKPKRAIAVNGSIPMPTLTFTEGDTAEIYVHNELDEETSLHWHGLFLPNRYDGVPNLTQMPIKPHTTHLYKFPIIQHGTHWYHSHTGL
ncbi:MAG: multicopper oxidase domain-containing protein, partial [Sediminibacterium sp.]